MELAPLLTFDASTFDSWRPRRRSSPRSPSLRRPQKLKVSAHVEPFSARAAFRTRGGVFSTGISAIAWKARAALENKGQTSPEINQSGVSVIPSVEVIPPFPAGRDRSEREIKYDEECQKARGAS